jgi:glycosyltransferase involved in cell wall biosynthesis
MKICVYAISKNEEMFVERFCESANLADLIVIADTGSTDKTRELAEQCGAKVYDICISPWRFDKARDAALALIPRDIDICISLDLDEVLEPGWREEIERVWKVGKTTRLRYGFDWGSGIRFQYEKIHARHGYYWHHPCHEYPKADSRIQEVYAETQELLVSHHPDPTKSRGQYLDLLKLAVVEDPKCPRNAFYYARELTFYRQWGEGIHALKKYLAMPDAIWINERSYAMRLLGKCYEELGNDSEAVKWYRIACAEAPGTREPWCDLAMYMYRKSIWLECYTAAKTALNIKDKQHVYTCDPAVWGYMADDLASVAAWNLGLKEESLFHARNAVNFAPGDTRLQDNLALILVNMENTTNI